MLTLQVLKIIMCKSHTKAATLNQWASEAVVQTNPQITVEMKKSYFISKRAQEFT